MIGSDIPEEQRHSFSDALLDCVTSRQFAVLSTANPTDPLNL